MTSALIRAGRKRLRRKPVKGPQALLPQTPRWCNGSTNDSGSFSPRSNRGWGIQDNLKPFRNLRRPNTCLALKELGRASATPENSRPPARARQKRPPTWGRHEERGRLGYRGGAG